MSIQPSVYQSIKLWETNGLLWVSFIHSSIIIYIEWCVYWNLCAFFWFLAIHSCATDTIAYWSRAARRWRYLAWSAGRNDPFTGHYESWLWSGWLICLIVENIRNNFDFFFSFFRCTSKLLTIQIIHYLTNVVNAPKSKQNDEIIWLTHFAHSISAWLLVLKTKFTPSPQKNHFFAHSDFARIFTGKQKSYKLFKKISFFFEVNMCQKRSIW